MSLVWVGWQLAGQLALDWDYFAYVLIPSCFIAIAGLLATNWPASGERHPITIAVSTAAILTLALGGGFEWLMAAVQIVRVSDVLVPVSGAVFLTAFAVLSLRSTMAMVGVFVVLFAAGIRAITPFASLQYNPSDVCQTQPAIYEAVVQAGSWLSEQSPTDRRVRVWSDRDERLQITGECTVQVSWMAGAIAMVAFVPEASGIPTESIISSVGNDEHLAIITSSDDAVNRWEERIEGMGRGRMEIARRRVGLLDSGLTVYLWSLTVAAVPQDVTFEDAVMRITPATPLDLNFYGSPRGHVEFTAGGGRFVPTDARDHAASVTTSLEPRPAESWARLTIQAAGANSPGCRILLQDQSLSTLASASCESVAKAFRLPARTQSIRAVLTDGTRHPIVLPATIEVALAK
jgi:hypothetical protein